MQESDGKSSKQEARVFSFHDGTRDDNCKNLTVRKNTNQSTISICFNLCLCFNPQNEPHLITKKAWQELKTPPSLLKHKPQ